MDYINAATIGTLSPHILPVMDLQKMLLHISDTLPPTLYLPVSPDDTLHFYRYLCTHVLIENNFYYRLMYLLKIGHDKSPSTKFLLWASHMEIFQPTMTSILNT